MTRTLPPDRLRTPRPFRTPTPDHPTPRPQPRPSVTVPASLLFGPARLQPLDIAVLLYLWLLPPGSALSHSSLVTDLQHLGWRSANGQPIGRDAIYTTLTRLITTGHLTRHQDRGPNGCLGPAIFTLHHQPTPTTPAAPSPTPEGHSTPSTTIAPGNAVPGNTAPGNTANGNTDTPSKPSPQVNTAPANHGHGAAPPTPPKGWEVTNPPPNPPRPEAEPVEPALTAPPADGAPAPARRPRRNRRAGRTDQAIKPKPPVGADRHATVVAPDGPAPSHEHHQGAIDVLTALPAQRPDLHLGATDLQTLAPLAAHWLARGATPQQLTYALTTGLPERLLNPAGILRHRLTHKMPPPPQPTTPTTPRRTPTPDDGTTYAAHTAARAAYATATEPARTAAIAQMRAALRHIREERV